MYYGFTSGRLGYEALPYSSIRKMQSGRRSPAVKSLGLFQGAVVIDAHGFGFIFGQ